MNTHSNPFEILTGFLSRFDVEVEGRQSPKPPLEVSARLSRLARGQLSAAEREELMRQLNEHPDWVAALAAETRAMRGGCEGKP